MQQSDLKQKLKEMNADAVFAWLARILSVGAGVIAITITLYLIHFNSGFSNEPKDWGDFGSFFGGTAGPILSFLSLVALLITIVLQNKELEATREELSRSASAQEKSEQAFRRQEEILNRNQFETTFFSLLEQHNSALAKLNDKSLLNDRYTNLFLVATAVFKNTVTEVDQAKEILEKKNIICGHYFRVLYQVLKFIATNAPGSEIGLEFEANDIANKPVSTNEKMYSNMVRSFLSYDLLQVLAINCYCSGPDDSYWKFMQLIERYEFLEHMPFKFSSRENQVLPKLVHHYDKAFGKSIFKSELESSRA